MTYLTRVPQYELRIRKNRKFDTPDSRHQDIMSLFGTDEGDPDTVRARQGILFRLEDLPNQTPSYLIRSATKPENLTPKSVSGEEPKTIPTKGVAVSFRIAVNAVQRVANGKSKIRSVYPDGQIEILLEEEAISPEDAERSTEITPWLQRKLAPALSDVHIINHQRDVLSKRKLSKGESSTGKTIQIDTIDGIAMVNNPEALQTLLENGVGRAKSYGCGLLTIKVL